MQMVIIDKVTLHFQIQAIPYYQKHIQKQLLQLMKLIQLADILLILSFNGILFYVVILSN